MNMSKLMWSAVRYSTIALLLAGLVALPGCGGDEPAPAQKAAGGDKPDSKAAEVAQEMATVEDALSLVPESADVALNIPALNVIERDAVPLAKRILGDDADVDAEVDRIVSDLAADFGVEGAESFDDIAKAKGLDFNDDIALFVEFSSTMAEAKEAMEEAAAGDTEEVEEEAQDVEIPSIAAVASVTDEAKIAEFLSGLAETELGLSAGDDVQAGDITIKTFDDGHGYFIAAGKVAVSNDIDFLKQVAARVGNPAKLRYGTPECPKMNEHEAAMLVFGANLNEDVKGILPMLELDENMGALVDYQMSMLDSVFGGDSGNDPMVITLGWEGDLIELKTRVDTKAHPGVLETSGQPGELTLAQKLPVGTQALVSMRFTDEFKKQIKETLLPLAAEASGNQAAAGMGPQVIDQIGDEVTIGIVGAENDFPQLYLMMSLAQPDATKSLLQMFVPQMEDQEHNGVMISTIAAPVPVPLSICYAGNAVIISNGVEGMKTIIDHIVAGTSSEFFAKLSPAIEPGVPRYSGVYLNTDLINNILPLLALAGGVPPEAEGIVGPVTETLQEVRMLSEMQGDWSETRLSLYLKPEEAAAN